MKILGLEDFVLFSGKCAACRSHLPRKGKGFFNLLGKRRNFFSITDLNKENFRSFSTWKFYWLELLMILVSRMLLSVHNRV